VNSEEAKDLNLVLEVEYLPGLQGKDTYSTLKSAGSGMRINITPGPLGGDAVTDGFIGKVNTNIKIIWARGHLHAGVKMVLKKGGESDLHISPDIQRC
jgi:hypothetical protein